MFARHLSRFALSLTMALTLAGCAGASLGPNSPRQVGRGTQRAILITVPETLNRFGYTVAAYRETPRTIYFETAWAHREPFEDEAARGVESVRTRFLVEARRGGKEIYTVTLRVENDAILPALYADPQWQDLDASVMFQDHVREITTAIRSEIDAGVRIY